MFENENESEQLNTGVEESASPEPQLDAQQESAPETQQSKAPQQPKEDQLPFHEHPRFKEVIEQKNTFARKLEDMERRYAEQQKRYEAQEKQSAPKSKEAQLIEELKGIRPEFGELIENLHAKTAKLDQFEQWQQSVEAEKTRTAAMSTLEKLHTEHKVPKELQDMYLARVKMIADSDPRIGLNDLPNIYKSVHDNVSKYMDSLKRSERESYLSDKKKDASAPTSQPKGKSPSQAPKKFSSDPEAARKEMVDEVMKLVRAEKDI